MLKPSSQQYFPPLTGIRAIAAYMVFLNHFNPFRDNPESLGFKFCDELNVGVTFFFVLSGFLLAYRYFHIGKSELKTYFVNRIARIYPMFILLTTLTFVVDFIFTLPLNSENIKLYLLNITFIKGFSDELKFSGIAQGWSLTVEETFYVLAPLFFFLVRKKRLAIVLLPIVSICVGILLVLICRNNIPGGYFSSFDFLFNFTFFGRAIEFFTGIGLAIIIKNDSFKTSKKILTLIGLILILISIYALTLVNGSNNSPAGIFINNFVLPVFGISIFYIGLIREKTLVSDLLKSKIMMLLGKSSYIFYLIHLGVFSLFIYKFTKSFILIFILINIISILLYKYIEQPFNRIIRRIFTSHSEQIQAHK